MKKVKPHKTVKLVIKTANIDKKMVPVINWLNGFENVLTKFCCEGGKYPHNNESYSPYVIFYCDDQMDLVQIVSKVGHMGVVEIRPPNGVRLIDYCIRFIDKDHLKMFKERL